jgi:YHS domain-containing protein
VIIRYLLLVILVLIVARLFWRLVDGILEAARGTERRGSAPRNGVKLVRDPVCGVFVAPGTAVSLTDGGTTHYFCSEECRARYHAA